MKRLKFFKHSKNPTFIEKNPTFIEMYTKGDWVYGLGEHQLKYKLEIARKYGMHALDDSGPSGYQDAILGMPDKNSFQFPAYVKAKCQGRALDLADFLHLHISYSPWITPAGTRNDYLYCLPSLK